MQNDTKSFRAIFSEWLPQHLATSNSHNLNASFTSHHLNTKINSRGCIFQTYAHLKIPQMWLKTDFVGEGHKIELPHVKNLIPSWLDQFKPVAGVHFPGWQTRHLQSPHPTSQACAAAEQRPHPRNVQRPEQGAREPWEVGIPVLLVVVARGQVEGEVTPWPRRGVDGSQRPLLATPVHAHVLPRVVLRVGMGERSNTH